MKVLVACEFSGVVRDAFLARGHEAWSCDLLPTDSPGNHIQGDVLELLDRCVRGEDHWDLMIAHPPCTYLTVAGQKAMTPKYNPDYERRLLKREKAWLFVQDLLRVPIKRICIENPVGHLPKYIGPYSQIVRMNDFGHDAIKPTCLWLKNLPLLTPTKKVVATIHTNPNGRKTSEWYSKCGWSTKKRNTTFQGLADAMAEQWG